MAGRKYTLDDFFRVRTEVKLPNGKVMTVRTLSDAETQSRERACAWAMHRRVTAMRDEKSQAYEELLAPYLSANREGLLNSLTSLKRSDFYTARREASRPQVIVLPDGPTPEERVQVEQERAQAMETWEREVLAGADLDVQSFLLGAQKWTDEQIRQAVIESMIAAQGRLAYLDELEATTLFYACEVNGRRFFKQREDVDRLPPDIHRALVDAYRDVYGVDAWTMEDFFETGI